MIGKRLDIKYREIVNGVSVEKIRYSVEKWQADDKYMGESFITFTVKSSKPIGFYVGDYCEYRGETYTLNYVPSVSQRGNVGDSGDSFVYESVKMDSVREELGRIIMLDITPTMGDYVPSKETNYTGSAQFQLYCGETSVNGKTRTPVCTLAGKIQANLDRAYPTKGWKVFVDTESTHEEAGEPILNTHSDEKVLTFDNTTVSAALAEVKNTFDIDYAIKGRTIYIGYTFGSITGSGDDYYYFGYGKGYLSEDNQGKALFELKRTADSNQKIVTRLRALGSTKNIPYRYYNKKYNLSQSMFPTNLQLPDTFETPAVKALHNAERKAMYPWIRDVLGETNDAYIDKNDNCLKTVEGLREDCMRWDGSNPDLKEIYPSIEEVTYKDLRGALCEDMDGNKGASSFVNYLDAERVDEILDICDDTNVGDGILTESNSTKQTASDADVRISTSETKETLIYTGSSYVGKEQTVMKVSSQYAGEYIISNSHLCFGASYSLGRHQSENVTKSCKVAYKIKVYAKPLGSSDESVICEYTSDFKSISNRDEEEYETAVAYLPDSDAATPKVSKIELTEPSDIRITFALVVSGLDYSYDQYTLSWRLGLPKKTETDTEWTPSLIWDLKGSASTFMKNPFHVYVKDMGFDFVAQFSTSDEPRIAMKTGMCVAREFKIGNNPERVKINKNGKTYNAWKLTLGKTEDSGLKTYYPSENFPLAAGDKFVVLGIEMPDVYVEAASMKLLVEATKALADVCDTKHNYEPSVDDIYLQRNYDRCEEEGDVTKSVYWKLASGMKFPFFGIREKEDETPATFTMIIDTLSIREGESLTPKVTIKLSEDFQQNTIQKLTRSVDAITKGSIFNATVIGNGGIDKSTIKAIVSEFVRSRYLSKINNDVAGGLITFMEGTNWGNFTPETGATMNVNPSTGQTYLEVDKLKVRLKAFFEQLEIQKVSYVGGKLVLSKGQGVTIVDVEEVTNLNGAAYRCYFLGEQEGVKIENKLAVGDQMICKDFNISEGETDGATNKYYWRLVTAVSSETVKRGNNVCHWVDLSVSDCDTGSDVPSAGDTICHLGNRSDTDRQGAEIMSVVDINSPSFTIYAGIDGYTLTDKEYVTMGVAGGKAYFKVYGDMYVGDRATGDAEPNSYLRWKMGDKGKKGKLTIKGEISIKSTLSGYKDAEGEAVEITLEDKLKQTNDNVMKIIEGFRNQIDGAIETWFFDKDEPELTDEPAVNWKADDDETEENKDKDTYSVHVGDLYYSKNGKAYRFTKDGDTYLWRVIQDNDIVKALEEAKKANDAANSKMRVFVVQPTDKDEYNVGDMWVDATYPADGSTYRNEILHCVLGKAAGKPFDISHWAQSSNIKTQFNNFVNNTYAEDKKNFYNQLDGKVETWYQSDDPKNKWAAADYSKHTGDIWYNDYTNVASRWTGTAWVELKDQAAIDAKALAESKRRVFTTTTLPTPPYDAKDLWVQGENGDIMVCVTPKAAGETASASDWAKASKYTDDSALNTFINEYNAQIADFSHQLDGKIETWYYDYAPEPGNKPASDWTTDELKASHSGDLFYNIGTGVAYRWTGEAWEILKDKEVQTALDNAKKAQDTADNKRRVFISQPTVPYDKGDLWVSDTDNGKVTKVCVNSKTTGTFSTEDWKESDDAALNKFSSSIMENIKGIKSQLDKKAETWYQADDPSLSEGWVDSEHVGDLWYDTANGETKCYVKDADGTYGWKKQDVPKEVFDRIDGKAAIYVSKPDTYHKNDLWFLDTDYTLNGVAYKKGTILVANATSNLFSELHWEKLDRYTDDSSLTDFINGEFNTFVIDIKSQVDKKAETWYQEADPSTSWKENEKAQHVGDLWWKPSDNLTYCYYLDTDKNTYGWKRQDVPQEVFDRIDGKAEIFVAKPTSGYHERDMWILEADYTFTVSDVSTKYKAGTIVIATATWAGLWQDSPCLSHWKKFDSYTDSESFNQLSEKVEEVKTQVGEFDNSIKGLKNELTEAFKDGILDGTERKSIKDCLKNAERECADVIFAYDSLVNNNDAYNTLDAADAKASFVAAYQKLLGNSRVVVNEGVRVATFDETKGSYGELVSYIKGLLDEGDNYLLTPSDIVNVNTKISNYTESYKTFSANLNAIRNLIDMSVAGSLSSLSASLGSYAYLKEALKGETSIQGGLVLSNVIALGDKTGDKFTIQSGVSGIVESSNGGGIAFWAGGSRIDKTLEPTNENAAKFLVRHDGTGYAAGGKFWWDDDGKIHADPTSFLVGENNIKNILGLFEPLYDSSGSAEWENIVGIKPLFMFDHLDVAGTGISIGSNKIYKNASGVIVIEGDLAVTGGITMFSSSGIVSGIKEQMLGVLDPSQFGERNGYISIIGEIGGGTVKGIKVNGKTYNTVDSEGLVTIPDYPTSLDWARIENKPTTLIQYGITDAKISDGVITLGNNTITPLTAHQSIYALTIIGIGENTFSYTPNSAAAVLALTPAWIGAPASDGTGASGTWGISVSGNAATANKLKNAVSVWGQSFDGSADITGNMKNVGSITPTGETLKIVGNLIVTGGITMYATDGTFDSAFGQQLANFVDNVTIKFVNDKLVAVNNGNVTSIIISGTEYKPTDGAVTLPDLFAPSAHKHAIADVNGLQDILSKKLDTSLKGTANGLATLDESGKVPSAQLPSYVDDVLEYTNKASFPTTGESGKIYIDQTTNLTYRWGGTAYVEISQSLALGETSSTAYAGDKGKQNATDIAALKTGKADKATTLAGYGITNAYTKDETDGKYLALAGGTMTGVISSTFASNTWINGVTNAIIKASYTGYGAVLSMPVYGGRVSISSYPGSENDNHIYFTYATAEQIAAGDNSVPMVRMSWDAATNTLAAAVFQGALSGNASSATKLLNARTLWGQNFDGTANVSGDMSGVGTITPKSGTDLKIVGNLIVTGGITMYADDGASIESGFAALLAAHIDGKTIKYNSTEQKIYSVMSGIAVNGTTYKPNETTGIITIPNYPTSLDWSKIENKPSTFAPSEHTHTFASLTSKPTTLGGYGITDAKIANGVITLGTATITPLTAHQTIKLESGKNNGTLKLTVGSTTTDNIAVKGLGSAAYTASSAYAAASHTHNQYLVAASLDGYVNALTDNTSTNVFVTAIAKSGKTLSYTKSFTKKSLSAQSHSGWKGDGSDELTIPDMSVIKYWNGAYDANKNSHLAYCIMGTFGDMATASKSSYYTKTEVNTKLTDGSVTKLGTASVGSGTQHFYLSGGTATASTSTVGGTAKPMYLKAGVMTAISDTVGSASLPVYLNAGTITACSTTLGVSITGNASTATKLQTARTLWGQSFNGSANISGNMSDVGQITFSALSGTNGRALLYQQMADNDYFRIYVGGTKSDAGYAEIATADNGNEPIYVRQYSGAFSTLTRTLTLLDGNGNTTVPGLLTAANGTVSGTLKVGAIPVTNSSTGVLKIDGNLIVTGGITMYATDGVASGLMEQILVDGTTIGKKADGTLYAINTGNVRSIIMGSTTYTPNDSGAVTLPEKVTWANIEGKPSTFTPSSHTHTISQITNLQTTLDGKAAASHTHSYLPLSGGTITGTLGKSSNYIFKPNGGDYRTITKIHKGAICISFPASIRNTMLSMWIDVYNYSTNTSFSVHVGGYTYVDSTFQNNPFAMVYGASHRVRLTYSGGFKIYIGETSSTWYYPQISVRDVIIGFDPNYSNWCNDWNVSFVTSFPTINAEISRYAITTDNIGSQSVSYASSAGNADTVDGYHASGLVKFYLSPMASSAPADSAKSWFTNTMPSASGAIVYNVPGSEKTIIAGKSSGAHGHMLQLNYDDNYLRILRYRGGSWQSTDWEKISAGYADSAATASKWATARTLTLTGSVTGSASIDGSGNVSLATSTNHTHSYADSPSAGGAATWLYGKYTGNGGQQKPNYFGLNKIGGLMMNTTINGNSQYKDFLIMDCYAGSDVGGAVAFGVNRQTLGAYIMRSAAERTAWAESAELIGTHNYTTYTVKKDGTGASGTWGISISGNAATATALTSSAGSSTTPVYFSGGKPVVCGSSLAVSITGNAATASKWATAKTITLTGSVTGSVLLDGSGNVTLETTTNHTHSYLPLAGGTMDKNARIAQASGNLYIGSSTNTGYVCLQDIASQKGTDYWNITETGVAVFYNSVTSTVFYGALEGNATTATTASKLGSSSVGSGTKHFYLNAGTATASSSTVGGTAQPMYLSAGTMTAISATVGSATKPVYLSGGTITACSSSLTDYLPLTGGQLTGDLYVQRTSDAASIWARYYDKTAIRMVASSSAVFIQCGNYAFTDNVPMYLSGPSGNDGSTLYLKFSSVVASGGITMYSDVRKKNILSDELLSVKSIADAPLFAFNYKSDEEKRLHTGTSAQYWHGAYGDMFGYKDDEGYYTLEYQNLGVAMGISLAREIVKYESKTDKKIRLMKKKINDLEARIKELEGSREERRTA